MAKSPSSSGETGGFYPIFWLRNYPQDGGTRPSARLAISEAHVRALSQHVSLPLLACHDRQQRGRLAQVAQEQGGLLLALDGLAPQGGEPHIWCMRDFSTPICAD